MLNDLLTSVQAWALWQQPIDEILLTFLLWFGWIPIAVALGTGFVLIWQDARQGQYLGKLQYYLLAVSVPPATEQSPKAIENMFASLAGAWSTPTWKEKWIEGKVQTTFSFEIISTEGYITFLIRVQTKYRDLVEAGIYAHYPEAEIVEVEDYTGSVPEEYPNDDWDLWGSEMKLKEPDYLPIKTYVEFEHTMTQTLKDPLGQMLEKMAKMGPGEHMWVQFLVRPTKKKWKEAGEKWVSEVFGIAEKPKEGAMTKGLRGLLSVPGAVTEEALGINIGDAVLGGTPEAPEEDQWRAFKITQLERKQVDGVVNKISKTGFEVKTRFLYGGRKEVFKKGARASMFKSMFSQFSNPTLNSFGIHGDATPNDDYFWLAWSYATRQKRLIKAYRNRSWGTGATPYVLNAEELASLWHFPDIGVKAPLVQKAEARRAEPPTGLPVTLDEETLPTAPVALPGEESPQLPREEAGLAPPPTGPMEDMAAPLAPAVTAPTRPHQASVDESVTEPVPSEPVPQHPAKRPSPRPTAPTRQEPTLPGDDVPPDLPI